MVASTEYNVYSYLPITIVTLRETIAATIISEESFMNDEVVITSRKITKCIVYSLYNSPKQRINLCTKIDPSAVTPTDLRRK